jgi:hypothetical protein
LASRKVYLVPACAFYRDAGRDGANQRLADNDPIRHSNIPNPCFAFFANGIWMAVGNSTTQSSVVSATAGVDNYMPNNWIDYYSCTPGQAFAFISTSTSTGYVSLTEMT